MSSCSTRRQLPLFHKKTCLLVNKKARPPAQQGNMSSCSMGIHGFPPKRHVFLLNKKTTSSRSTGRHIFLPNGKSCCLVQQEGMQPSCSARRYAACFNRKTCLLVEQGDMPSCLTIRHVLLLTKKARLRVQLNKKTLLLVQQEYTYYCSTRQHFLVFNEKTCLLV